MKDFFNFNLGIVISLLSIFLTLYINFRTKFNFDNSFKNSPNDRSVKFTFKITNLSNQAKSIDDILLYKGNEIIKDNGYIYSKVEEDIKNENSSKDKEIEDIKRKKQINEDRLKTYNQFYKDKGISYEDALDDIDKYRESIKKLSKIGVGTPFNNLLKGNTVSSSEIFDYGMSKPSEYDDIYYSNNFKDHKLLTKDTFVKFSYWVNYNEIPDKVKIVSKNRINWFKKYKYFKIN